LTLHAPLQSEINEEATIRIGDISTPGDTKWQKSNFECGTTPVGRSGCTLSGKDKKLFGKSHSKIEVSTSNYRKVIHEAQNTLLRPER
jgi:hypothetical protein